MRDLLIQAAGNTVLGMGTTFFVLIILSLVISSFTFFQKKEETAKEEASPEPGSSAETAGHTETVSGQEDLTEEELVALITAAVAAHENREIDPGTLVIRPVRRVPRRRSIA